jgi:hypothetical protein
MKILIPAFLVILFLGLGCISIGMSITINNEREIPKLLTMLGFTLLCLACFVQFMMLLLVRKESNNGKIF